MLHGERAGEVEALRRPHEARLSEGGTHLAICIYSSSIEMRVATRMRIVLDAEEGSISR